MDTHWLLVGSHGDGAVVRLPPFEQIELDVGRLFLPKPSPSPNLEP